MKLRDISFKESVRTISKGYVMLGIWAVQSANKGLKDLGIFALNHPIFTILIGACYIGMASAMTDARLERDVMSKKSVAYETTIDSLKIITHVH